MKPAVISLVALCSTMSVCLADGHRVDLRGVTNASQVIGFLGIPLGASAVVVGTVQLDPPHRKEQQKGEVVENVSIETINGERLDVPIVLEVFPRGVFDEDQYTFKHGDRITAKVVERVMTYGRARDADDREPIQTRRPEYRLHAYVEILKLEGRKSVPPQGHGQSPVDARPSKPTP